MERIKRGWTRGFVATVARISKTTLKQLEDGERNPTLLTVIRLENLFGMSCSQLFGDILEK